LEISQREKPTYELIFGFRGMVKKSALEERKENFGTPHHPYEG
jgi:hypothetical protein